MVHGEMILELKNITKKYPGITALKNVDFDVKKGEIMGLVGKNGAGKSTLIRIISGLEEPTDGKIYWNGKPLREANIERLQSLGFRYIPQEVQLIDTLSVEENLSITEFPTGKFGNIQKDEVKRNASKKLQLLDWDIPPDTLGSDLSMAGKVLLTFVKEITAPNVRVVALDEITTSLPQKQREEVFKIIEEKKKEGVSFIFTSHEVSEIKKICDRITVLRDGNLISVDERKDLKGKELEEKIIGKKYEKAKKMERKKQKRKKILSIKNLSNNKLKNVNLEARSGEVIGIYGLKGSGKTELLKTVFGLMPVKKGSILYKGEEMKNIRPQKAMSRNIIYIPEDRGEGLFYGNSIKDNLMYGALSQVVSKLGFINTSQEKELAQKASEGLDIIAPMGLEGEIDFLSGGNAQKTLLGSVLTNQADLLLLDEVTKGIDIGVKEEVYSFFERWAAAGKTIIMTSNDLTEVSQIPDRTIVLKEGTVRKTYSGSNLTEENLLTSAGG